MKTIQKLNYIDQTSNDLLKQKQRLFFQLIKYEKQFEELQEAERKENLVESHDKTLMLYFEELYLTMKDNLKF